MEICRGGKSPFQLLVFDKKIEREREENELKKRGRDGKSQLTNSPSDARFESEMMSKAGAISDAVALITYEY